MRRDIDISDLPQPVVDAIDAIVRAYRESRPTPSSDASAADAPRRTVGWAKDILPELPVHSFDPLPPDLLDAFEGKAA